MGPGGDSEDRGWSFRFDSGHVGQGVSQGHLPHRRARGACPAARNGRGGGGCGRSRPGCPGSRRSPRSGGRRTPSSRRRRGGRRPGSRGPSWIIRSRSARSSGSDGSVSPGSATGSGGPSASPSPEPGPGAASLAAAAQRQVDGDPVDPCVERAFPVEPAEFLIRTQERLLQQVLRVLGAAGQPQDGGVKSVLVTSDQDPVRLRLTRSTRVNEPLVVGDCRTSMVLDDPRPMLVP